MVAIATDTFATSMQAHPSKPHLSRGTHLLIKTVSIGLSHMKSHTGFSQFPSPFFFSLEPSKPPPKDKQDFNRFQDGPSQVIFLFQRKFPGYSRHVTKYFFKKWKTQNSGSCEAPPWCRA